MMQAMKRFYRGCKRSGATKGLWFVGAMVVATGIAAYLVDDVFSNLVTALIVLLLYPFGKPMFDFWVQRWVKEKLAWQWLEQNFFKAVRESSVKFKVHYFRCVRKGHFRAILGRVVDGEHLYGGIKDGYDEWHEVVIEGAGGETHKVEYIEEFVDEAAYLEAVERARPKGMNP